MRIMKLTLLLTGLIMFSVELFVNESQAKEPEQAASLASTRFQWLPTGAVRPEGWLRDQLHLQATGLTGHLDEFWPDLKHSKWRGDPKGEAWERGPYYLDGLVPLAWILNDQRLQDKAMSFLDPILKSGKPDGQFGPGNDTWSNTVAMKSLCQYYEATGDSRVLTLMTRYFHYLIKAKPDWPNGTWRGMRAMETVLVGIWLYEQTKDQAVLDYIRTIQQNSFDWCKHYSNFKYTTLPVPLDTPQHMHETHIVNVAMSLKNFALLYRLDGDIKYSAAAHNAIAVLERYHGQAGGRFSGDEHFSGKRPTQGTELCAIVEMMFSLETLIEAFGDVPFSDQLELLAYNGNPGACTPDYHAHQYDQQANQVLVDISKRQWSNNTDSSNVYGIEPHFGCCTANMHQGWPKFVARLWMSTPDHGLAAVAYGPCTVSTKLNGQNVSIREVTDYPFDGAIAFQVDVKKESRFPLYFRIPAWAGDTTLSVQNEKYSAKPGTYAKIDRVWKSGDTVQMTIPLDIRVEKRYNDAVALYRGPLLLSLRVGERFEKIKEWVPGFSDWKITPTTPWNYGLVMPDHWKEKIQIKTCKPSSVPFDGQSSPLVVRIEGRRIPGWGMDQNSAADPPKNPTVDTPTEWIELVPYGSTRLRITEFPVISSEKK